MNRWLTICQDCFAEEFPDEYCPNLPDMDDCSQCGQHALVAHISPKRLQENSND